MMTSEDMKKEDIDPHSMARPQGDFKKVSNGSVARVGKFERIKTSGFDTKVREEKKDTS